MQIQFADWAIKKKLDLEDDDNFKFSTKELEEYTNPESLYEQ